MEIIIMYVVVIALFAGFPMILDICLAYHSQNKTRNILIEKASIDKLNITELKEFVKDSGKAPPGIPGLARATIALTVIIILGIAVFHMLVKGIPVTGDNSQIINNILSMLAGLLAAITGFYFGGKTVEFGGKTVQKEMEEGEKKEKKE